MVGRATGVLSRSCCRGASLVKGCELCARVLELKISERGSDSKRVLAGSLVPLDSSSRFRFALFGSFLSLLDLLRKENVGFRALMLGGVSCNSGGGEEGGVMVLESGS